jgi:hypothetical protein
MRQIKAELKREALMSCLTASSHSPLFGVLIFGNTDGSVAVLWSSFIRGIADMQ